MSPSVLFVGHNAYRAGAQIELLHLLRWLQNGFGYRSSLVLVSGGDLVPDYQSTVPTQVLRADGRPSLPSRARTFVDRRLGAVPFERQLRAIVATQELDLVYLNSAASLGLVPLLARITRAPMICHVHELEASIRKFCGLEVFRRAVPHLTAYVAASGAVEQNLIVNHAIDRAHIHRVYEGIVASEFPRLTSNERLEARRKLGIAAEAFVIGGCGSMDWRKAPDVFLQVARRLAARSTDNRFHFVWVGGDLEGVDCFALRYDAERFGVAERVQFVGPQRSPREFFSAFDAFFLSSREDPFPLVCLEAAAMGLPILCFANAGGMPEFVEEDAGYVVPYLDVDAAAERFWDLSAAPELCAKLGQRAAEKLRARFDFELIAKEVDGIVQRYATRRTGVPLA
jgi:glycosyltransferase involved in cell wall biosynthesis